MPGLAMPCPHQALNGPLNFMKDTSPHQLKENMARAFEDSVTEVLVEKTRQAIENLPDIKTLIVAGGVSANIHIAEAFRTLAEEYPQLTLRLPIRELSTDNAIMIGIAAFIEVSQNPEILINQTPITARGNLSIDSERSRTISSTQ